MSTSGRCSPELDPDARAPQLERVGGAHSARRWPVALGALEVVSPLIGDLELFPLGEAQYAPPAGEEETWPRGRYVFEVKSSTGAASGWMGIEFLAIDDGGAAALR